MASRGSSKGSSVGYAMILEAAKAAGLSTARRSSGHAIVEKAERDELAFVPDNDPAMAAAFRMARTTLPAFLALAAKPLTGMDGFAVKIALRDGCDSEYFWIHPFERKGARFHGRLNNTPRTVGHVRIGDIVVFSEDEIVDWMYLDRGAMKGNFSAQALLKSASPEEREAFRKRYGLDFDL